MRTDISEESPNYSSPQRSHVNVSYLLLRGGHITCSALDKGANVNVKGKYGNALCVASGRGYEKVVQMLLDKGANVNAKLHYLLVKPPCDAA